MNKICTDLEQSKKLIELGIDMENYEQKYKKALERAKAMIKVADNQDEAIGFANTIFPELVESEDERIKEDLIQWINEFPDTIWRGHYKKDVIAWLEKQGGQKSVDDLTQQEAMDIAVAKCFEQSEQKSADKAKPKFKVGDWVVDNCNNLWKIVGIMNGFYILEDGDEGGSRPTIEWVDKTFHLWTIQDAKDGDVLASKNGGTILIFRNLDNNIGFSSYYNTAGMGELGWSNNRFIPATKEQRDQLEKAMTDAGYKWDADKKELRKMENSPILSNSSNTGKQWTEEDEKNWRGIMYVIEENKDTAPDYDIETYDGFISWLDNIKQRMEE